MGRKIAAELKGGSILALTGELGSGKTTFVQGFAKGLGLKTRIISPTFILMRLYRVAPTTNHQSLVTSFYHVDLYRFEKNAEREVVNLGLTDLWEQKENIVVIEWAEKIRGLIPMGSTWIKFEVLDENRRKIMVKANFKD